jgi:hypothetical protein
MTSGESYQYPVRNSRLVQRLPGIFGGRIFLTDIKGILIAPYQEKGA